MNVFICRAFYFLHDGNLWINYLSPTSLVSQESDVLSCYSDAQNNSPFCQMSCNRELGNYYPVKMQSDIADDALLSVFPTHDNTDPG